MAIYIVMGISVLLGIMYFRVASASHDPAEWHIDPLVAERPASPNTYFVAPQSLSAATVDREAPIYSTNPSLMAKALDDFILAQSSTLRIAGGPEEGWMTYVQRTPSLRMPDYISIKLIDISEGRSTIAIYSRSRFGYGDMGVNKVRVETWLSSISTFEE